MERELLYVLLCVVIYSKSEDSLDYMYYDSYEPDFQYSGEFCQERYVCNNGRSYPDKNCFCDSWCKVRDDCCPNKDVTTAGETTSPEFSCVQLPEIIANTEFGIYMIKTCSSDWTEEKMKQNCESDGDVNILLKLPVTNIEKNILYKNMYCAYCNFDYEFKFWNVEAKCVDADGLRGTERNAQQSEYDPVNCDLRFIRPNKTVDVTKCHTKKPVSSCMSHYENSTLNKNCTDGKFALVYNFNNIMYRNEYCAKCNDERHEEIMCEKAPEGGIIHPVDPKTYSFRLLVDFNSDREDTDAKFNNHCNDSEMYDPLTKQCREILCMPPTIAQQGRCIEISFSSSKSNHSNTTLIGCTFIKLDPSEYSFLGDMEIYVNATGKIYSDETVLFKESDVFVCVEIDQPCDKDNCRNVWFQYDAERLLSLIGLIISIVAIVVAVVIYLSFPQLLNTPGKILTSLMLSLFFAQLLFLVSSEMQNHQTVCIIVAVLVHFFFLAAFCWMNIIAFDLWMTFSKQFISPGSGKKSSKRFYLYNLYAWLVPVCIVAAAVVLDNVAMSDSISSFQPHYGSVICWINSRKALLLFFAGPLALFKLFDVISFIFTAINIIKAKKQGAMVRRKKNTCSLLINIKLSLVMGLTWVFAFVANAADEPVFWYLFILFNTLQGLFICVSFVCTKKVFRLIRERYQGLTSTTTGTQSTQLSRDKNTV